MSLYWIGFIVLPLGLFFFLFSPKRLYAITVFSMAFTGTAAIEISVGPFVISGIRPVMVLGFLCLVRHAIAALSKNHVSIDRMQRRPLFWLGMFAFITALSLVMPAIINGDLWVLDAYTDLMYYAEPKPLKFSFQYVTQVAYFLFGCLLAYYFAVNNRTPEQLTRTMRIYLYSIWFMCLWGIFEFAMFYLPGNYPAFIFNQISTSSEGTTSLNGLPRITSVSLEPSIMNQQLFSALPMVFWTWWDKEKYLHVFELRMLLGAIVIVTLLSNSSTALGGLLFFALIVLFKWIFSRKIKIAAVILIFIGVIGILVATPFIIDQLREKLGTFSGVERLRAIQYGWQYFLEYPVLGIGWGAFPSWDLVVCILTGCGILGFIAFVSLISSINSNFKRQKEEGVFGTMQRSVWHSLLLLLAVSQISGFIYHSQYFWLILGLAIAASGLKDDALDHSEQ